MENIFTTASATPTFGQISVIHMKVGRIEIIFPKTTKK